MSELYKGYIVYYADTHEFESALHCDFDERTTPLLLRPQDELPHAPLPPVVPLPPEPELETVVFSLPERTPTPGAGLARAPASAAAIA